MTAHSSRLRRAFLAGLILVSVIAATGITTPVVAQSTTTTPSPSPTTGPAAPGGNNTTTTKSHWYGNGAGGNSGLIGGGGLGIGPKSWYDAIVNASKDGAKAALKWQINKSVSIWIGTPYDPVVSGNGPESPTIKSINTAMADLRQDVYGPYVFQFLVLLVGIFILISAVAIPASTMFYGASLTRWLGKIGMTIFIVGLSYDLINILQQTSNAIAWGIAPSAEELTKSMSGLFKLAVGPPLAGLVFYFAGLGEALALGLIYGFRQVMLIVSPIIMPLILIIAYGGSHRRLRAFGSTMFWQWFNLCFVNIPVAFFLRIAYEMDWGFGVAGFLGFIMTLGFFLGALVFPFITSWAFFKYPPAVTGAAIGAATTAESRVEQSRENGWWGNDDDNDDGGGGTQQSLSDYTESDSRFGQWRTRAGETASSARDSTRRAWSQTKDKAASAKHVADVDWSWGSDDTDTNSVNSRKQAKNILTDYPRRGGDD